MRFETKDAGIRNLVLDPQTSGGLLLSITPEKADVVLASLRGRFPKAEIIGRVVATSGTAIRFL